MKNNIDREVDDDSLFQNSFSFEKMFAGNFFGDVIRRILHKLAVKGALFGGKVTRQLETKDSLVAADCVNIERCVVEFVDCFFHVLFVLQEWTVGDR